MALSLDAARIWKLCNEYVSLALRHLELAGPFSDKSSDISFDTRPELLRINFLFPRIAEPGLNMLLELRKNRWLYQSVLRADEQHQDVRSAHDTEHVEARFDAVKTGAEQHLLPHLSGVQQEIIREKFFRIDEKELDVVDEKSEMHRYLTGVKLELDFGPVQRTAHPSVSKQLVTKVEELMKEAVGARRLSVEGFTIATVPVVRTVEG